VETIFSEGIAMATECMWALVFFIYVGTIIKNLDLLSEQVSHMLNIVLGERVRTSLGVVYVVPFGSQSHVFWREYFITCEI
jgi:hypothetical protein